MYKYYKYNRVRITYCNYEHPPLKRFRVVLKSLTKIGIGILRRPTSIMISTSPKTATMAYLLLFPLGLACALGQTMFESHEKYFAAEAGNAVANSYIVVMKDPDSTLDSIPGFNDNYVKFRYDAVLFGYGLKDVPESLMAEILDNNLVKAVYDNQKIQVDPIEKSSQEKTDQMLFEPWGLDR
jgi:hypothetical protein